MAWNMGNAELIRALLGKKDVSPIVNTEAAAAQAVADALLRAVGRQAIIAAAADAVAALGCSGSSGPAVTDPRVSTSGVNPGGGQGDPNMPESDHP
jgi:hypothetical protein